MSQAAADRELISRGVIYDTRQLKLRPERIEKSIRARCKMPSEHQDKFVDALSLANLPDLSRRLAQVGAICPEPIIHALGGKLASAVQAVPPTGFISGFESFTPEYILSLIVEVAKYHLLISLVWAGEAAYRRCFEPTGMNALDEQPGTRATTVRRVAGVIAWNASWMLPLLNLYLATKNRPATQVEEDAIKAAPGLLDEGLRWEQELNRMFGASTRAFVKRCHRLARYWSGRIHTTALREMRSAHANTTMYTAHGTEPLDRLWLTRNWVGTGKSNNSALERAMTSIRAGRAIRKPAFGAKCDVETRQLFFLVRNCVARDPKAQAVRAAGRDGDLMAAIERVWQAELIKKALATKKGEPFSAEMTTTGRDAYRQAVATNDQAFLAEVDGLIWRQLQL